MTGETTAERVALVTGASRGIGYACALGLARSGAHVIATARTQGGLEALDDEIRRATGRSATLVPLDIQDGDGVDRLGRAIYDRWERLDVLISAAGDLGLVTPMPHLEPKVWDRTVAVNLTANYRLIRSLDPLLRQSPAGRAVFLTTEHASEARAFFGPLAVTKAGLEMMVGVYADEVAHTPVRCVLLDPGPMRTRMRAFAFPGEDPESVPLPDAVVPLVLELVRPDKLPPVGVVRFGERTSEASSVEGR